MNAWRLDSGNVEPVDLFGSTEIDDDIPESPDVYVGMHNKQVSRYYLGILRVIIMGWMIYSACIYC